MAFCHDNWFPFRFSHLPWRVLTKPVWNEVLVWGRKLRQRFPGRFTRPGRNQCPTHVGFAQVCQSMPASHFRHSTNTTQLLSEMRKWSVRLGKTYKHELLKSLQQTFIYILTTLNRTHWLWCNVACLCVVCIGHFDTFQTHSWHFSNVT